MSLFAGQQWRCRHREQTCGPSRGRRGWVELRKQYWHIDTIMLEMQGWWEAAVWLREPSPVLSEDLLEWESWAPKSRCFSTVVLEKALESPWDCKKIKPVHPKGNQSWIFIGRTDAEAETPIILATRCEEITHWKPPWCWERLKAGGEGEDRGWDGWMVSSTQWT